MGLHPPGLLICGKGDWGYSLLLRCSEIQEIRSPHDEQTIRDSCKRYSTDGVKWIFITPLLPPCETLRRVYWLQRAPTIGALCPVIRPWGIRYG